MSPFIITSLIITTAYARIADRKAGKIGASTNLELELAKTIEQIEKYSQDDFFNAVVDMENCLLSTNTSGDNFRKVLDISSRVR